MWKIGENVEIRRLKEQLAKVEAELLQTEVMGAEHLAAYTSAEETIKEWEAVGINRFSSDEPDDVDYSIQSLIDDHNQTEEDFEEECEDLKAENKKLKEDLAYANRRWGVSLDQAIKLDDYLTQLADYCEWGDGDEGEVFHKITNNEFKEE